jgi:hypothetical protein
MCVFSNAKCSASDLLALKLQQDEMESPPKVATQPAPVCIVDPISEEKSVPDPFELAFESTEPDWQEASDNIKFEADAAVALLQLKRTRELQS